MIGNNNAVNQSATELTDEEMDAIVRNLPTVTAEAKTRYQKIWDFMLEINRAAGVFQTVTCESTPEEHAVANSGKYMDTSYGMGAGARRCRSQS